MGLYLGDSGKLKLILDNVVYRLNIFSETIILNGVKLLSSDNYILKDSNNVYLTVKESE